MIFTTDIAVAGCAYLVLYELVLLLCCGLKVVEDCSGDGNCKMVFLLFFLFFLDLSVRTMLRLH